LKSQNASVEIRTTSEDEEPGIQSLVRFDRRQDAGERTSISASAPARDAGGSGELRRLGSPLAPMRSDRSTRATRTERAPLALGGVDHRQRLARDLHDGAQNELVALIVKLAVAQEAPETPPALAHMLAEFEAHAQVALDSVRNIAQGIYPPLLADFGLGERGRPTHRSM